MSEACPECGKEYKAVGTHWRHNPDHRPSLSEEQREIITGSLMGDGNLYRSKGNPIFRINMITNEYLEWTDEKFGILGAGVRLQKTAKKSAEEKVKSGFRPNACHEDYSDVYSWRTRSIPSLSDWDWYKSGSKVWPDDIDLTPTALTHWYVGDGHYKVRPNRNNRIEISMANEADNTGKVSSIFENSGLPSPSNYNIFEHDSGEIACSAQFSVDGSNELFDYMNEAPPGFEYKFPD